MTRKTLILSVLLLCSLELLAGDFRYSWSAADIDGSTTGVKASDKTNLAGSVGLLRQGKYIAPNGRTFRGCTKKVAALMLAAQTEMDTLRTVIAYSPQEMVSKAPESALSNFTADAILCQAEKIFGRKVDLSLLNFGGIRVSMPEGNVEVDDIVSMFPFNNTVVLLTYKGKEIRAILQQLAKTKMQVLGGVRIKIKNGKLLSAQIGGEELDDEKEYAMVSISFLLDGGDKLYLRNHALSLRDSGVRLKEAMLDHIRSITASGKDLEAGIDGRVVYVD